VLIDDRKYTPQEIIRHDPSEDEKKPLRIISGNEVSEAVITGSSLFQRFTATGYQGSR